MLVQHAYVRVVLFMLVFYARVILHKITSTACGSTRALTTLQPSTFECAAREELPPFVLLVQ